MTRPSDVVVVGAGPAGCSAAILLARRGWTVDLLERRDPASFKLCTHAIMPAGVSVLEELGLLSAVESAGATRWWGGRLWLNGVSVSAPLPHRHVRSAYGLSLRRQRLDPLLLEAARLEPGVRVLEGCSFTGLVGNHDRVSGVHALDRSGFRRTLSARVVVGADGRHSPVARAARLPEGLFPNRHAAWIAYIAGVPEEERPFLEGYYWHGHSASLLPADGGLRAAGVMIPAGAWDPAEASGRLMDSLRRFPPLRARLGRAQVIGQPVHISGLRNLVRSPQRPGLVLTGDAALQTDPAFGQGISWALQGAAAAVPEIDLQLLRGTAAKSSISLISAFRRPQFLAVFGGTALLSAIQPGSWPERLLAANAAAGPASTALALRLGLSLVTSTKPVVNSFRAAATIRLAEALRG